MEEYEGTRRKCENVNWMREKEREQQYKQPNTRAHSEMIFREWITFVKLIGIDWWIDGYVSVSWELISHQCYATKTSQSHLKWAFFRQLDGYYFINGNIFCFTLPFSAELLLASIFICFHIYILIYEKWRPIKLAHRYWTVDVVFCFPLKVSFPFFLIRTFLVFSTLFILFSLQQRDKIGHSIR